MKPERIFVTMAEFVYEKTKSGFINGKIKEYIGKKSALKYKLLDDSVKAFVVDFYKDAFKLLFILLVVMGFLSFMKFLSDGTVKENTDNSSSVAGIVKRDDVNGMERTIDITITDGETKENRQLILYPRVLTKVEFERLADEFEENILNIILGDNSSLEEITGDLNLVKKDESGMLKIVWSTDNYDVISDKGVLDRNYLLGKEEVVLTATISSGEYEREKSLVCFIKPIEPSKIDEGYNALISEEEKGRENEYFQIPGKYKDIEIQVNDEMDDNRTICKLFMLGLIIIGIYEYLKIYRLKEDVKKRDEELRKEYFVFVNRLVLYLGAGLSMKNCLSRILNIYAEKQSNLHLMELMNTCLNLINSGCTEESAYTSLGLSINLPEYIRLMSLISQNLSHGNKNLLLILKAEEKNAVREKKEYVRKLGEEANEKLIFPMILLMIIVIGIILAPAVFGYL